MNIRKFHPSDLDQILNLFYHTVHAINKQDYTQEQLDIWAPKNPDKNKWLNALSYYTFVAVKNDTIVGFADICPDGLLDHLFVHKDFQGQSIASMLLKKIEEHAKSLGLRTITTHSVITAMPFFIKKGFVIHEEQTVTKNGINFINYLMLKHI